MLQGRKTTETKKVFFTNLYQQYKHLDIIIGKASIVGPELVDKLRLIFKIELILSLVMTF